MADRFSDSSSSDHVQLKIPSGDSPYVMAKHVQLVEKDPNKAIALFWRAINSADRVDSALKDMAVVMKQLDRAEEAIEAIKSFRGLCSIKAQEPLDNVLLDLYKKCGRVTEQIDLLNNKLRMIDEGTAFGGKIMKTARSQGKKFHITVEQEKSRLLGNLAWAYMQCENYREAEPLYRRALEIEKDYNKMCNLAICLMQTGRLAEAEIILADVKRPTNYCNGESYQKSYGRAWEMMKEMELKPDQKDVERNSSVSTPCSIITEKTKAAPSIFDMASPEYEVSPDALTQGSIGASSSQEAFLSPVSVKVTSQCKPVMISEYSVERKNADGGTENLVISLDIQMLRPKGKEFVVNSKKVPPLASNDQSFDRSKASTDAVHKEEDDDGVKFRFESPDLSLGPNADQPLFCKTEKKTWADLVEEDEKLTCEIAEISGSSLNIVGRSWADIAEEEERSDNKSSECGSYGGHQQSTSRTPISSCKKLNRNETLKWTHDNMNSSSLKTGNQKYRSSGYKELSRRWRGTAKNAEQERRTLSSDRWPGCNFRGGKLVPELIGSGGKSCEDSDYLSGMGGRYSCGKQRNRLQVFQEITPGDAKA